MPATRFVLFYDYVEGIVEKRAPFRGDHLALANEYLERGELLMAGAFADPVDGAAFVFSVEDRARVEGVRGRRPVRGERARALVAHPRVDRGSRRRLGPRFERERLRQQLV